MREVAGLDEEEEDMAEKEEEEESPKRRGKRGSLAKRKNPLAALQAQPWD